MAQQYPGLLPTTGDKHQSIYQGLLNMGANMGGYSDTPSSFISRLSKGGAAFGQGMNNHLNQTRADAMQNMNAQTVQQQIDLQQQKMAAQKLAMEQDALKRKNLDAFLKQYGSQPGVTPTQLAMVQADPEAFLKAQIDAQNPTPTNSRPSAPIQNFMQRQQLVQQHGEGSPEVRQFDNYVRATQYLNTGANIMQMTPQNPTQPIPVAEVELKPGEQPEHKAQVIAAEEAAKREQTKIEEMPNREAKIDARADSVAVIEENIERAKKLSDSLMTSGVIGAAMEFIPGSEQNNLNDVLEVIKSDIGLNKLISVKEQGGTFGALQKAELDLLVSSLGSLNAIGDPQILKNTLDTIVRLNRKGLETSKERFEKDYPKGSTDLKSKYGLK
jgi:hypothetical protein